MSCCKSYVCFHYSSPICVSILVQTDSWCSIFVFKKTNYFTGFSNVMAKGTRATSSEEKGYFKGLVMNGTGNSI